MPPKPDPERIDDETPEADAEWFRNARPANEVLPGLVGRDAATALLKPKRGRPPMINPKEHLNIRLDADIVGAFRRTGAGWQTRLNDALRDCCRHTHSSRRVARAMVCSGIIRAGGDRAHERPAQTDRRHPKSPPYTPPQRRFVPDCGRSTNAAKQAAEPASV